MTLFDFQKKKAFIGYITGGDGGIEYSIKAALALEEGGVDILEIGIPFSDPVADGPVIQKAMARALDRHITPWEVLEVVRGIREKSQIPIVLMSYFNPLLALSEPYFLAAKEAGVNGLIIVDLPFEEKNSSFVGLEEIYLITPSTQEPRMRQIAERKPSFLYYVIQKGTTGMRSKLSDDMEDSIKTIKKCSSLPVVAGFGISTKEQAQSVLQVADGFVVGSLFVDAMGKSASYEEITQLAKNIDPR